MGELGFDLIVGAPPRGTQDFDSAGGWWAFHNRCRLTEAVAKLWPLPKVAAPCEPLGVGPDPLGLRGSEHVASQVIDGQNRLPFWLHHPPGSRLPAQIGLTFAGEGGVWSRKEGEENGEGPGTLGLGIVYRPYWGSSVTLGEIPKSGQWVLASSPERDDEWRRAGQCWTAPLVLRIGPAEKEPARGGQGQGSFWTLVIGNDNDEGDNDENDNVVDVQPSFPTVDPLDPADRLRIEFHVQAAELAAGSPAGERSAVQRLVFGCGERPTALWFLILDALGGEFRLRGFLSGDPTWEWAAPPDLPFWPSWLAGLACRRGGILRAPAGTSPTRPVPPASYKSLRWPKGGNDLFGVIERSPWSHWLAQAEPAGGDPVSWRAVLAASAAAVQVGVGQESGEPPGAPPGFNAELLARHASARFLLPRSPVRVELPAFPLTAAPEVYATAWKERVGDRGWLDLVSSALWPEERWPEALLLRPSGSPEPAEEGEWSLLGTSWHDLFYSALHRRPASLSGVRWRLDLPPLLGRTALGRPFVLGRSRARRQVEEFLLI